MNCTRIEELLPAYLDGALAADESARVKSHVAECASCEASLADFEALETALLQRRTEVPPAGQFLDAIVPAAAARASRARVVMDRVFSFPVIVSFSFAMVALWTFLHTTEIAAFFSQKLSMSFSGPAGGAISKALSNFTGGDMMTTSIIYGGVTLIILLSTSLLTLRFVRHE